MGDHLERCNGKMTDSHDTNYTCLMSVYKNDDPAFLREALQSMSSQTIPPNELLLIQDGPLTEELEDVIASTTEEFKDSSVKIIALPENKGLWYALQVGMKEAENELVLRMDSDDISVPNRAELQLEYMNSHPECDCCGSTVIEFEGTPENELSYVDLPENHEDIVKFSKMRDPIRHPTLLFKKSRVLRCGNYQDMPFFEDYDLILRMLQDNNVFYNIQSPLVKVRVNENFFKRRGDRDYLSHMMRFKFAALRRNNINALQFVASSLPHAVVCLLPNTVRRGVYKRFLRSKPQGK